MFFCYNLFRSLFTIKTNIPISLLHHFQILLVRPTCGMSLTVYCTFIGLELRYIFSRDWFGFIYSNTNFTVTFLIFWKINHAKVLSQLQFVLKVFYAAMSASMFLPNYSCKKISVNNMQMRKYRQITIAKKRCMINIVQETSGGWSWERCRKILIESCLINFERVLDFLNLRASTAYCFVNNEHL